MSLDHLMYEWIKTKLSTIVRAEAVDLSNVEPPLILYESTDFIRNPESGSAASYPNTEIRIKVRSRSGSAYNASSTQGEVDDGADGVISALSGQVPSLTGFTATGLVHRAEPGAVATQGHTDRVLVFLTTITSGFGTAPLTGGDGSFDITGLDGQARRYQVTPQAPVNYDFTTDEQTVETACVGFTRVSGFVDWVLADSAAPMPVVGSSVSADVAVGSSFSWTETIKITGYSHRHEIIDAQLIQVIRISFVVDNENSPWITGVDI